MFAKAAQECGTVEGLFRAISLWTAHDSRGLEDVSTLEWFEKAANSINFVLDNFKPRSTGLHGLYV